MIQFKQLRRSPGEIKHEFDSDGEFYNLTMTYRLDSDINWYYGITIDLTSGKTIAPSLNVKWRMPDNNFNGLYDNHDSE